MARQQTPLPKSLPDLQKYIWQKNFERGFNTTDPSKKLVILLEEAGELAKAVRKAAGLKFTATTQLTDVREELADVLIVLLGLASMLEVDLFSAVEEKEIKNNKRVWK